MIYIHVVMRFSAYMMSLLVMSLARTEVSGQMSFREVLARSIQIYNLPQSYTKIMILCLTHIAYSLTHGLTGSTELNTSAPHKTALEHFEMNTNDAYGTNTAEIATTGNVAYMTAGDAIPTSY